MIEFQSPSLRGSGRFHMPPDTTRPGHTRFNPLHCGAVVASVSPAPPKAGGVSEVSIPFIAGQWSLRSPGGSSRYAAYAFQSPSLRGSGRFWAIYPHLAQLSVRFQSPSLRGSGRFPEEPGFAVPVAGRFNPLHCGAVVASDRRRRRIRRRRMVSIPFIAGQWSLRAPTSTISSGTATFQSPSLRGSGRFYQATIH